MVCMFTQKLFLVLIDLHSRDRNTMEVNGEHQLLDYKNSSKYIFLCSRKKLIEVWKDMRVSKWKYMFNFKCSVLGELSL